MMLISKSIFFRTACIFCIGLTFLTGLTQAVGSTSELMVHERTADKKPTPLSQDEVFALSARSEENSSLRDIQAGDEATNIMVGALAVLGLLVIIAAIAADNSDEETSK